MRLSDAARAKRSSIENSAVNVGLSRHSSRAPALAAG
jgi:hypothetical protein